MVVVVVVVVEMMVDASGLLIHVLFFLKSLVDGKNET